MDNLHKTLALQHIEQEFAENDKVRGSLAKLSDGRVVFIGEREGNKDDWFIGFRNSAGDDTKLRLSKEAMSMLMQLYKQHPKGDDVWPLQIKTAWQVVVKDKEEERAKD